MGISRGSLILPELIPAWTIFHNLSPFPDSVALDSNSEVLGMEGAEILSSVL
jgi:hypothetical protein